MHSDTIFRKRTRLFRRGDNRGILLDSDSLSLIGYPQQLSDCLLFFNAQVHRRAFAAGGLRVNGRLRVDRRRVSYCELVRVRSRYVDAGRALTGAVVPVGYRQCYLVETRFHWLVLVAVCPYKWLRGASFAYNRHVPALIANFFVAHKGVVTSPGSFVDNGQTPNKNATVIVRIVRGIRRNGHLFVDLVFGFVSADLSSRLRGGAEMAYGYVAIPVWFEIVSNGVASARRRLWLVRLGCRLGRVQL